MEKDLEELLVNFRKEVSGLEKGEDYEKLRIKYLGRKSGLLTKILGKIPKLPQSQRAGIGSRVRVVRSTIEEIINGKLIETSIARERSDVDVTIPGKKLPIGSLHPLTIVTEEIKEIFHYLGFTWVDGPEVESDIYNFQKLNMPPNHPARDVQQTYYLDEKILLRTHTSNMQVRYLEKNKPPVRVLFPGRVFRRDMPDATHLPSFYQLEGLLVDETTSMTELLGSLDFFVRRFFGKRTKTRIYGHHFPYTEPSIEVEVLYPHKGWIEILGAGMVHPNVLRNANLDPSKYRGWAFGMGPDRLAMLKFNINDIRLLYKNSLNFLNQF